MKDGILTDKIAGFLCSYCTTPQSATGVTPAELLMNQKLRTKVDLLKPDLAKRVTAKQEKHKSAHDHHASAHLFKKEDEVQCICSICQEFQKVWAQVVVRENCTVHQTGISSSRITWRVYSAKTPHQRTIIIPHVTLTSPDVFF